MNFGGDLSIKRAGRGGELWFFVRFLRLESVAAKIMPKKNENGV